jgi:DNA repair protein RecO (recombination protein O)
LEITTDALVLRTRAYGESDRIVTLITATQGKVTGIAKGAKNSRKRFAGTLEPFVCIRASFTVRPNSDLAFLLRCELVQALRSFSRDLECYAAGTYVLELADRMVHGREPGAEVFRLVREAILLLDAGMPSTPLLRAFELHLLAATGYAPDLDHCRGCGRPTADPAYLAVARGGLFCRACVPTGESVRCISRSASSALTRLARAPLAEAADGSTLPREATDVTEQLLAAVITAPMRSRAFLERLPR